LQALDRGFDYFPQAWNVSRRRSSYVNVHAESQRIPDILNGLIRPLRLGSL
jgi:hypothetical protein